MNEDGENLIFLIDIGNTHVHIGLCVGGKFQKYSKVLVDEYLVDSGLVIMEKMLRDHSYASVKILMASVNAEGKKDMNAVFEKMGLPAPLEVSPLVIRDYATKNGMDIPNYPFLGSDLFCDIIAAKKEGRAVFVVDGGTCLKVLGMTSDGKFLGGAIGPGRRLMIESIGNGTSFVKVSEVFMPKEALALSTEGAVSSSLTYGVGGMVLAIIDKAKKDFRIGECDVIVTGGDSQYIAAAFHELGKDDFEVDDLLTVKGLALAFHENSLFD